MNSPLQCDLEISKRRNELFDALFWKANYFETWTPELAETHVMQLFA